MRAFSLTKVIAKEYCTFGNNVPKVVHKTEAVLLNSQKIEQIASQNSVQVQEMTTAIDEMGVYVKRLQAEIDKFKV